MPLKPLLYDVPGEDRTITLTCKHAATWPPHWHRFGTADQLREDFLPVDYERARTWERMCGLQEMNASKCPTCPSALKEDGQPAVPLLTVPAPISQRRRPRVR